MTVRACPQPELWALPRVISGARSFRKGEVGGLLTSAANPIKMKCFLRNEIIKKMLFWLNGWGHFPVVLHFAASTLRCCRGKRFSCAAAYLKAALHSPGV